MIQNKRILYRVQGYRTHDGCFAMSCQRQDHRFVSNSCTNNVNAFCTLKLLLTKKKQKSGVDEFYIKLKSDIQITLLKYLLKF